MHTKTTLNSIKAISPPAFPLGTTTCLWSSAVPMVGHSYTEGIKRAGVDTKPLYPLAIAVLKRAQQALAQGSLAGCVEPYVVTTNFSLHNSETNPHPALHQVKPLRRVVCGQGTIACGTVMGVVLQPVWPNSVNVSCQAQWSHWRCWAKLCINPGQVSEWLVPRLGVWSSED